MRAQAYRDMAEIDLAERDRKSARDEQDAFQAAEAAEAARKKGGRERD